MKPKKKHSPGSSLARALSKLGVLSRSQSIQAIQEGRVAVNGQVSHDPSQRVKWGKDELSLDGLKLDPNPTRHVLMLNKPRGLVTTRNDELGRPTVFECLQDWNTYLFPVGRLDAESEGLLLFTNDSQFSEAVANPTSKIKKKYEVVVHRPLEEGELFQLVQGTHFADGTPVRPLAVSFLKEEEKDRLEIVLNEGKNRAIRRICEGVGLQVKVLRRFQIGSLALGDLEPGKWKELSEDEIGQTLDGHPLEAPRRPGRRSLRG